MGQLQQLISELEVYAKKEAHAKVIYHKHPLTSSNMIYIPSQLDDLEKMVRLAFEIGRRWRGQKNAWKHAAELLHSRGFTDWNRFFQIYHTMNRHLGLDRFTYQAEILKHLTFLDTRERLWNLKKPLHHITITGYSHIKWHATISLITTKEKIIEKVISSMRSLQATWTDSKGNTILEFREGEAIYPENLKLKPLFTIIEREHNNHSKYWNEKDAIVKALGDDTKEKEIHCKYNLLMHKSHQRIQKTKELIFQEVMRYLPCEIYAEGRCSECWEKSNRGTLICRESFNEYNVAYNTAHFYCESCLDANDDLADFPDNITHVYQGDLKDVPYYHLTKMER